MIYFKLVLTQRGNPHQFQGLCHITTFLRESTKTHTQMEAEPADRTRQRRASGTSGRFSWRTSCRRAAPTWEDLWCRARWTCKEDGGMSTSSHPQRVAEWDTNDHNRKSERDAGTNWSDAGGRQSTLTEQLIPNNSFHERDGELMSDRLHFYHIHLSWNKRPVPLQPMMLHSLSTRVFSLVQNPSVQDDTGPTHVPRGRRGHLWDETTDLPISHTTWMFDRATTGQELLKADLCNSWCFSSQSRGSFQETVSRNPEFVSFWNDDLFFHVNWQNWGKKFLMFDCIVSVSVFFISGWSLPPGTDPGVHDARCNKRNTATQVTSSPLMLKILVTRL